VLTVTRNVDDNWYEGRLNGRQGLFPVNYVERLSEVDCLSQTTSSVQGNAVISTYGLLRLGGVVTLPFHVVL